MFCSEKGALDWNKWAEEILANREKLNDKINNVDYYSDFKVLYYDVFSDKLPSAKAIEQSIENMLKCAKNQSRDLTTTIRQFVSYSKSLNTNNEFAELKKILNSKGINPKDLESERKKAEEEARRKQEEQESKRKAEEEARRKQEEQERNRREQEEKKSEEYNNITEVKNWSHQARSIINQRNSTDVKPLFQDFLMLYYGMTTNLSTSDATIHINKLRSHLSKINNREIKNALLVFCSTSTVAYKPENNAAFKRILKAQNLTPNPNEKLQETVDPIKPSSKPNPNTTPKPRTPRPVPTSGWARFDYYIENIGEWLEDISEDLPTTIGAGIYILSWIGLAISVIATWISEGFIWAALTAVIGGVIVYYASAIFAFIFGFILAVLIKVLRYVFYNALTLVIAVVLFIALVIGPGIADWASTIGTKPAVTKVVEAPTESEETPKVVEKPKTTATKKSTPKTTAKAETTTNPATSTTSTSSSTETTKPKATTATATTTEPVVEPQPVAKAEPTPTATAAPTAPKTANEFYDEGVNLAKQFKESEAIASLKKAVDLGSVDAAYYLGMMYVNSGDASEGFSLVLNAANAGHKEATFQVAEMYNGGVGTSKDKAQAKSWYQKAEALGDSRATSRLRKL